MAKIKDKFTLLGDLIKEIRDVKTRLTKLNKFKVSDDFYELSGENQDLLNEQYESMIKYLSILEKRFEVNKQFKRLLIFYKKNVDKYIIILYNRLEFKIQEEEYGKEISSSKLE